MKAVNLLVVMTAIGLADRERPLFAVRVQIVSQQVSSKSEEEDLKDLRVILCCLEPGRLSDIVAAGE
jgi:hypothetical protein